MKVTIKYDGTSNNAGFHTYSHQYTAYDDKGNKVGRDYSSDPRTVQKQLKDKLEREGYVVRD